MILRLLKKLRTTVRTIQPEIIDVSPASLSVEADRSWPSHSGPQVRSYRNSRLAIKFSAASLTAALILPSLSSAQEFRNPTLPNQQASQTQQSQQQHEEALKQQMFRVQQEQGAPAGFAEKAFQAQQAYLTEMAYQEQQAYQQQAHSQRSQQRANQAPPVHRIPAPQRTSAQARIPGQAGIPAQQQRTESGYDSQITLAGYSEPTTLPKPMYIDPNYPSQQPNRQPSQYVPPVHVAPSRGVSLSFGDSEPVTRREPQTQQVGYYQGSERQDSRQAIYQASAYQAPKANSNRQEFPRQLVKPPADSQNRNLAQTSSRSTATQRPPMRVAQNPIANRNVTNSRPAVRQPLAQPALQRPKTAVPIQTPPDFPYLPNQKVHGPNEPYVLGERPVVGLQDRITELLSKPRYREVATNAQPARSSDQPIRSTLRSMNDRIGMVAPKIPQFNRVTQQVARSSTSPRQAAVPRVPLPQVAVPRIAPRQRQIPAQVTKSKPANIRTDYDVQLASEMAKRIRQSTRTQAGGVQQVAMVEPAQDPFNDGTEFVMPTLDAPTAAPAKFEQPEVTQSSFQSQQSSGGYPSQLPARQISVLSQQDQDQDFSPSLDGGIGQRTDEELDKIDRELSRRLQELDEKQKQDAAEKAELDDLSNKIEQDIAGGSDENPLDSVIDEPDDLETFADKPPERTCDDFRAELLNSSIRDISLDMSPTASAIRDQYVAISRSWTDRSGRVIATGTMVDLRRGYVILDGVGGRQKIPYAKLSDADWAAISEYWQIPKLCSVGGGQVVSRNWVPQTYTWTASAICHKPLFFENIQLERYGHSRGPIAQPVHSVAHFFVSLVTIPYQSKITPANECQYALGFYRPGNCAPWLKDPVPLSLDGFKHQLFWTTAAGFIP